MAYILTFFWLMPFQNSSFLRNLTKNCTTADGTAYMWNVSYYFTLWSLRISWKFHVCKAEEDGKIWIKIEKISISHHHFVGQMLRQMEGDVQQSIRFLVDFVLVLLQLYAEPGPLHDLCHEVVKAKDS